MRKLMIVMALLVAGCLPQGYIKPQYVGTDAAKIVFVQRGYMGYIFVDNEAVNTVDVDGCAVLNVRPGVRVLSYQRGYYAAMPLSKEFESNNTYYFDIIDGFQIYFDEYTKQQFKKIVNRKPAYK
jgi:hypothetical protein